MRNVDCEYLIPESHDCFHKKIRTGLKKIFRVKCIEYKYGYVDCKYRESMWDMLKVDYQPAGALSNRPQPPVMPPSKRKLNF